MFLNAFGSAVDQSGMGAFGIDLAPICTAANLPGTSMNHFRLSSEMRMASFKRSVEASRPGSSNSEVSIPSKFNELVQNQ